MKDVIRQFDDHHQELAALCNSLEQIADQLPDSVDIQNCLYVSRAIYPAVKSAHDFEERVVFSQIQNENNLDDTINNSLERLRFEHWEDEDYAAVLSDNLHAMALGDLAHNSELFGFMLRGFFESMRRHIAFEVEYIKPILLGISRQSF